MLDVKTNVCTASVLWALCLAGSAAAQNQVDTAGRLERLRVGKGWQHIQSNIVAPQKGWSKMLTLDTSKAAAEVLADGSRKWRAVMSDATGTSLGIEQTVSESEGKLIFDIQATGNSEGASEGLYFWLDFPAAQYAGGTFQVGAQSGTFPRELPAEHHLMNSIANSLVLKNAAGNSTVTIGLSPHVSVQVQDGRKWSMLFSALIQIHAGTLAKGQKASLQVTLSAQGAVEEAPAMLSMHAPTELYQIDGIGGNYCFNIESPVTRYTLDNLNVAYARTEMTLLQWEPQNDNDNPAQTEWPRLVAGDKPKKRLNREFEIMRELTARKIPFASSIWNLPHWLYAQKPKAGQRNIIAEEKWPEVLECIGSYLLYAKEKYQAEPDFFSFNEAEIGIQVFFTPEGHRDAIKRIGAHLKQLGLKTKMLLGDVANARDTQWFVEPALADAEAMAHVGALAFHSWGGASPQQYGKWPAISEKLKLPLLVAEAGVDAQAYEGGRYNSFEYGVREMVHYQELFLYARPQAILLWEFTGDYSLLHQDKPRNSPLRLTERFCFQKHWCDLIPPGSKGLLTETSNPDILLTAFKHQNKTSGTGYTIHLSNSKWARNVTLLGLPDTVTRWNVVRTSRGELFKEQEALSPAGGKIQIDLPPESLTTLTTLAIPALKEP